MSPFGPRAEVTLLYYYLFLESGLSNEVHFNLQLIKACVGRRSTPLESIFEWATFWNVNENHGIDVRKDVAKRRKEINEKMATGSLSSSSWFEKYF